MKYLFQFIDYIVNRANRRYSGYISPRSVKQFSIPLFEHVGTKISSIPDLISLNIEKEIKGLRFNYPLVVCGPHSTEIAQKKLLTPLKSKSRDVASCVIDSNSIRSVLKVVNPALLLKLPVDMPLSGSEMGIEKKYGGKIYGYKKYDIVYGIGGGTVIDVAKYAAYKMNLPFVSIPTSLSNDGFASPFSVLDLGPEGVATLSSNTPLAVVVDIDLVISNDTGYRDRISAGIGDLLSNLTALQDWKLADKKGLEQYDSHSGFQARCGAEVILNQLQSPNTINCFNSRPFLEDLACSLISSAEAMARYGSSRPASGFEHKFYHALNSCDDEKLNISHGCAVAIGSLISSYFHGEYFSIFKKIYPKIGLPNNYESIEKFGLSRDTLKFGIEESIKIKPSRYTILEEIGPQKIISELDKIFN